MAFGVADSTLRDNYNPGGGDTYAGSGSNNGSGLTQDWYVHTQSLDSQ